VVILRDQEHPLCWAGSNIPEQSLKVEARLVRK